MRWGSILCAFFLLTMYLGLSDGYLAIFRKGDSHPVQVLPYHSSSFPESDQKALADGIVITSQAQLNKILEDFIS